MEVFLNNFHWRSFTINDVVKSYREKIVLKYYSWSLVCLITLQSVLSSTYFFIRMSNGLDLDQDGRFVWSELVQTVCQGYQHMTKNVTSG